MGSSGDVAQVVNILPKHENLSLYLQNSYTQKTPEVLVCA